MRGRVNEERRDILLVATSLRFLGTFGLCLELFGGVFEFYGTEGLIIKFVAVCEIAS